MRWCSPIIVAVLIFVAVALVSCWCCLVLSPDLIKTEQRAYRPFQGWRYLEPVDAPADLQSNQEVNPDMPIEMEEELRGLGLL